MNIYTVDYKDRQGQPCSINILADSEEHAVAVVSRWETPLTNVQATLCQEVDYVK